MPDELLKFIKGLDLFDLNNNSIKWFIKLFKIAP